MSRCSCGRSVKACGGAYSDDAEHDRVIVEKAERALRTGRTIDPDGLKAARIWSEVAALRPDLLPRE